VERPSFWRFRGRGSDEVLGVGDVNVILAVEDLVAVAGDRVDVVEAICVLSAPYVPSVVEPDVPLMPSFSSALTPPGCSSSPTILSGSFRLFSSSITLLPCLPNATAAAHPTMPAPTMTISASWCTRRLSSRWSAVCVDSIVGTLDVEVPLARSCGEDVLTPGGSAAIFVPENIVSMVAVGESINCFKWASAQCRDN
jgi:hypothetical protein